MIRYRDSFLLFPSKFYLIIQRGWKNRCDHALQTRMECHTRFHFLFVDDMILFMNGKLRSLRALRDLLRLYEESSGQQINFQKSLYFPLKHVTLLIWHHIEQ